MVLALFSDIPWEGLHQRPQHLATWLSARVTVLWVEPATLGRRVHWRVQQLAPGLFRLTVPMLPLNARNRQIKRLARLLARLGLVRWKVDMAQKFLFRRAVRRLGGGPVTFLVENFQLCRIIGGYPNQRVVFDYIDDAFGFTEYPEFIRERWKEMLRRADSVVATSPTLAARINEVIPREVAVVPNGVEFERFADTAEIHRPADLPPRGLPIVGYTGSVYPWLDFQLLESALETMPAFHFVLIGNTHTDVAPMLRQLSRHENFHFLGPKPYREIPAYVHSFNVGMIPFLRNRLTEGVNPVKLYEYFAAGVPTVITDFSDDLRTLGARVFVAKTQQEFAEGIRRAAEAHKDRAFTDSLREFAQSNDWQIRFQEIARYLQLPS